MREQARAAAWGALFDWDGVIVDSKALHRAAWDRAATEFGFAHGPDDFKRHFGSQNRRAITEILGWTRDAALVDRISERKEALYRESLGQAPELLLPGVAEFLALLHDSGVRCVVVSSSPRVNIEHVANGSGVARFLERIISAEDAERSKPDPQGFQLGAAHLGLPPEQCVVFEDAPAGIEAGRRGGMRVVALTTTHPAGDLGAADLITDALRPALIEQIQSWFLAPGAASPARVSR